MDPRLFVDAFTGSMVNIPRDAVTGNQHAFVPAPLPPNWEFPMRLWPLLADAKQQLGILEGLGRSLPNPGILLRPLEDREAIKSSRLEGTYVTATELLVFEMQPRESKSEDDPVNPQREVLNYRKALQQGVTTDIPLSLRLIRDLHKTLMTGVRGKDRTPGEFRRGQVAIGTSHRFVPPPPEKLMECLDPLEKYFHLKKSRFDPLVDCCLIHYQFETIHPFNDGNGRVGRLLLAIMLKELCCLSKPWLYMAEYYEKHMEEYYQRLFNVSTSGDWEGWIEFCLVGVASQARDAIQRCDQLQEIKEAFMQKLVEVGGAVRLNQIVENIFHAPFVRIKDLPRRLGITYPTAKADVERLVEAGILRELKDISPKTYYAPDVFNVAYAELD
jgi:Fic family protein